VARLTSPLVAIEAQRGHLFVWVPVFLAFGIGIYFALRFEPGLTVYLGLVALITALVALSRVAAERVFPPLIGVALVLAGICIAGARSQYVAGPILGFRYYGPIEGRIITIDRSVSDKLRLTLDQVRMDRMSPERTPLRVRVSLHGEQGYITPEPGLRIMLTGHLSPPNGPVEPGGFDFRRMAWFTQLGAMGYTRSPVLMLAPAQEGAAGLWVHRLRMKISAAVQQALPGEAGAFAAAITTGDRSGMSRETTEALRGSNLSHLLAISGLHMGLLTGFVLAAMRIFLVLIPWIGLRLPVKKVAAVTALAAGAFYYLLSGGNVATERAFIMVSVMFVAILFDRRAITLRAVAIAAIIVLVLRPETLTQPGFQMSFAATTALVAVFGAMRDWTGWRGPKVLRPFLAVVISSAVAGLATAPVAAAHFNRIADYGLLANLLSVPLMGSIVMPFAVLTAILTPIGLGWVGLAVMRPAIDWILGVAHWVSGLEGAVTHVISPPAPVLPLFAVGMLFLILWQGRLRFAGLAPAIFAFVLWFQSERPPVLIAESGAMMGVMTEQGRALSKPRGDGFTASSWLENDGDGMDQMDAAARPGWGGGDGTKSFVLNGKTIVHLSGRGAEDRIAETCRTAALVIIAKDVSYEASCLVYDIKKLRSSGALAVFPQESGLKLLGAKDYSGARLWSGAN
jgi:competence protein ComEC